MSACCVLELEETGLKSEDKRINNNNNNIIIIDTFIKRHKCLGYRGAENLD